MARRPKAATHEPTPPPTATPRRGKRGPAPDPTRAGLIPVLYRVTAEQHEALAKAAEERSAQRWKEEVEAAKREGRRPRLIVKRRDASEILRGILEAWKHRP